MKWRRNLRVLACLGVLLSTVLARAGVRIDSDIIFTGTRIEVLGPGPNLQMVINKVMDEGPSKPYLIKLGPGEYTIDPGPDTSKGLVMAQYVSIEGSGRGVTVLKGAISSASDDSTAAVVTTASDTILTDLSVENTGGGTNSIAIISAFGAEQRIERVSATASGGTNNYAVLNLASSPTMTDVSAAASGGSIAYGVYNFESSPAMTSVSATSSGASGSSYGVYNTIASSPTMTAVSAAASGGGLNYGVHNFQSSPTMTEVTASASGGNGNYAVSNQDSSPTMNEITATASGGINCHGVSNVGSSPTMTEITATAEDGNASFGVYNSDSSPTMTELHATASGGMNSTGVYNVLASSPRIRNSYLSGGTNAIAFGGITGTRVSETQLEGGIDADPAGVQCRDTYDENLADVTC